MSEDDEKVWRDFRNRARAKGLFAHIYGEQEDVHLFVFRDGPEPINYARVGNQGVIAAVRRLIDRLHLPS